VMLLLGYINVCNKTLQREREGYYTVAAILTFPADSNQLMAVSCQRDESIKLFLLFCKYHFSRRFLFQ